MKSKALSVDFCKKACEKYNSDVDYVEIYNAVQKFLQHKQERDKEQ